MFENLFFAPFRLTGGKPVHLPGGNKMIFLTLHRVVKQVKQVPYSNDFLDISASKLESLLLHLKGLNAHFVDGNFFHQPSQTGHKLLVHLTVDDGYKTSLTNALPILERHNIPFTLFLSTGIPDRQAVIWWYLLEELFERKLYLKIPAFNIDINTAKLDESKYPDTFDFLKGFFLENYAAFKEMIDDALKKAGLDSVAFLQKEGLSWDDVRRISKNCLCTLGNHTANHFCMSKLPQAVVLSEINHAQQRIKKETGLVPFSLAFPFGIEEEIIDLSTLSGLKLSYAFTAESGIIRDFRKVNRYRIPRYFLNESVTPFSLNMIINGMRHRVNRLFYSHK